MFLLIYRSLPSGKIVTIFDPAGAFFAYMDENHFDAIYTVEDDTAFSLVREAAEKEGLLIGLIYRSLPSGKIVTIFDPAGAFFASSSAA
jgi:predicted NUDIX family NTP pyrophosphohydrolase